MFNNINRDQKIYNGVEKMKMEICAYKHVSPMSWKSIVSDYKLII